MQIIGVSLSITFLTVSKTLTIGYCNRGLSLRKKNRTMPRFTCSSVSRQPKTGVRDLKVVERCSKLLTLAAIGTQYITYPILTLTINVACNM